MTGGPEDDRDWTDRITPPMLLSPLIMCMVMLWISSLLRKFPLDLTMAGLALAGAVGYGISRGLRWLGRRSRAAAVVALLCIIGVIVFLWPVACVTQGGKFGTPVRHFCRCEGLTVTTGPDGYDVPITTYCLGLETADVWEEKLDIEQLN